MRPNSYIAVLKEYPVVSHKAWEYADKSDILKLDWNEAEIDLPPPIKDALIRYLEEGKASWYPDVANKELLCALASYAGVSDTHVQYFEGSDCALDYAVRTFVEQGDTVVLASPTYDNVRVYIESTGARPFLASTEDPFAADPGALLARVPRDTRMLYLANPNNPTGTTYSRDQIAEILTSLPDTVVIVDEAYAEFAGSSITDLVDRFPNVIVSRSFSKAFGLAAFRIGYLVSTPENLRHINKIRNGKNISAIAQVAALAALRNREYMEAYVREVRKARAFLCTKLARLGIESRDTPGNFILIAVPDGPGLRAALADQNIFIRSLDHLPGMDAYLRITVGTMSSSARVASAIEAIMTDGAYGSRAPKTGAV
jgi:histidinol-phosphate aminotransferase